MNRKNSDSCRSVAEGELQEQLEKALTFKGVIIVEGKKDKAALEKLGFDRIIILDKPIYEIVEKAAGMAKECMILTDLDKEGKKLYHELSARLKRMRVKVDDRFRTFLFRTQLRQIEGLATYAETNSRNHSVV